MLFRSLFNVIGGYASGMISARYSRRLFLFWIYIARAVVTAAFLLLPVSNFNTLLFGAAMGLLWLSTRSGRVTGVQTCALPISS